MNIKDKKLTDDGLDCVIWGADLTSPKAKVPVRHDVETGASVFACAICCGEEDTEDFE
jgi:hypothetical protein